MLYDGGILICAKSASACENIASLLTEYGGNVVMFTDGVQARACDASMFELIIISTPLTNEFGLDLAADMHRHSKAGIIVITKSEIAEEVQKKIKFTGAFVLERPINKSYFVRIMKLAKIAAENTSRILDEKDKLDAENAALKGKIDDLKIINRAKICLMEHLKFTEEQAHRYIQKQAMNTRRTQREISGEILKTYTF